MTELTKRVLNSFTTKYFIKNCVSDHTFLSSKHNKSASSSSSSSQLSPTSSSSSSSVDYSRTLNQFNTRIHSVQQDSKAGLMQPPPSPSSNAAAKGGSGSVNHGSFSSSHSKQRDNMFNSRYDIY